MAISKVEFAGEILMDLTHDTVNETNLLKGAIAHDKAGDIVMGSLVLPVSPKFSTIYSGLNAPESTLGEDGDIYLQE